MKFYSFLAIIGVWFFGMQANSMGYAFLATLAILHTMTVMQDKQLRHEAAEDQFTEDFVVEQVVSSGPVFPEEPSLNHLHFLEEPNSIGVFSYDPRTHSWSPVGEVPYPAGRKPEQVATIVPDKNL
jgi:hypothetical protein